MLEATREAAGAYESLWIYAGGIGGFKKTLSLLEEKGRALYRFTRKVDVRAQWSFLPLHGGSLVGPI